VPGRAVVMTMATVMPASAPAEAQACTLDSTTGLEERTIGSRRYEVYVPAGITGPEAMLVLSLHGFTASGLDLWGLDLEVTNWEQPESQAAISHMQDAADQYKFILAFPVGDDPNTPLEIAGDDLPYADWLGGSALCQRPRTQLARACAG
jgi:poly(3-hydroxybutyrate) depolymerase